MREKFIQHGIPFDDLDVEMIELIDVLNFDLKLKTQFCCYGHDNKTATYVIFDEIVTDEEIMDLLKRASEKWAKLRGKEIGKVQIPLFFYKWARNYPIMINWQLELSTVWKDPNSIAKKERLKCIVDVLRECKK